MTIVAADESGARSDSALMTTATASPKEIALNRSAQAPEWIQLLPPGPTVSGRDGRSWTISNPQAVVAAFDGPIPLDFEHSTQIRAPKGERADAAGWIEELQVRDGAVWGRVDWNEAGRAAVENRGYRFISPGFLFGKESGEILKLVHAGLVNTPNFSMQALNRKEDSPSMSLSAQLKKALELKDDAKDEDIVAAVNSLQAKAPALPDELRSALDLKDEDGAGQAVVAVNSLKAKADTPAAPDFAQYAPRADLDAAINRANTAEAKLATLQKEGEDAAINAALDQAIEDGKITPGSREFYEAGCRADGGLERFQKFANQAPAIAEDGDEGKATAANSKRGQMTDEETAVCRATGVSTEDYLKSRDGEQGAETQKKEDA